jgi:ADP-ribosylglycohydrolase
LIGAIIGDVIGSIYENENTKHMDFALFNRFSRFTDDSVLTVATADALLNHESHPIGFIDSFQQRSLYAHKYKEYGRRFPNAGYGEMFKDWVKHDSWRGYQSYGNGSAMRVSPIGFAFDSLPEVLHQAKLSTMVTHNHLDAIAGAQAVAAAIFLAKTGSSKDAIRQFIEQKFGYSLKRRLDDIRPIYQFDSSCKGSVPEAIIAFLESDNFEDAIRKAVSLGGDSDTIACIYGGIAQTYYQKIPGHIVRQTQILLDDGLLRVVRKFNEQYQLARWLQPDD